MGVAGEDYSGSSCTKVADASSGTNEDETDDTTGDCASCFDNDQFFCQDGAGYCVSTRAECKNDATMIKKVVGCSSIVDPVANDDEEPKPEPEPEQATDDPGPEPEEEVVDPAPEPEEDTEEE